MSKFHLSRQSIPTKGSSHVAGSWTQELVAGKVCDVYHPAKQHAQKFVVIYLHGVHLNTLHDKIPLLQEFEKYGLTVVCPMTQRSWWTNRICEEFDTQITAEQHLLQNILPFIQTRFEVTPPKIGLLGTSMGGQGALRFSYKFPHLFPVVAAMSPAIDYYKRFNGDETIPSMYDDPEAARQDSAILHVHPLNWPRQQFFCCDPEDYRWWDSADRLRMKLGSIGIPFDCDLETTGGGHSFDYYGRMAPKAIHFLVDGLERESRRLV
jgi:S-formylglutathione hydrolase FrmB